MDGLVVLAFTMMAAAAEPAQSPEPSSKQPAAAAAAQPNLSGHWTFNPDQSEDAREKMREAVAGRSGGFGPAGGWGGHRGGGGPGGRGGRRGGGGPGGPPRGDQAGTMRSLMEAPAELTITQTEAEITIMPKDGALRILHPDGRKYRNDTGSSEVKASWDEGRLVVETRRERGPKISEAFSLSPDGKQLLVQLRFEGRADVTVKRTYDAEASE